MNMPLRCVKGHRWESAKSSRLSTADPDLCPECGDLPLVEEVEAAEAAPGVRWDGVRLGPQLPMSVYTSLEVWHPERIGALALYCSDGRWGEAFDEFCHRRLLIPRYDRWAVPGGPAWLAERDNEVFTRTARQQLDFLVRVHELERIVLITHYGCAHYGEALHKDADGCLPAQMDDVRASTATLREWFPQITAEGYLAMRHGNCLTFHRLDG